MCSTQSREASCSLLVVSAPSEALVVVADDSSHQFASLGEELRVGTRHHVSEAGRHGVLGEVSVHIGLFGDLAERETSRLDLAKHIGQTGSSAGSCSGSTLSS